MGFDSSLALTEEGLVYSWGSNSYGKLGIGSEKINFIPIPKKIEDLKNIHKIKCGTNHCLALDKDGVLYSWGSGTSGELGNG